MLCLFIIANKRYYFTRLISLIRPMSFVERKLVFKIVQVIDLVDLTFQMPKTFANA